MRVYPKRIVAAERFDDPVSRFHALVHERPEDAVPDYQDTGIVLIKIRFIDAVMDAMMGRRVKDQLDRAEPLDEFRVDPELIDQIESVHHYEHPRSEPEQHHGRVEDPMQQPAEPALPDGDAQIVLLARMMDDVKIPEKPRLVTDAVEPVVGEIVNNEKNHPRPPRVSGKLERR